MQISTSNQFIVNYSIHSNTTDTNTLSEHLQQHEDSFGAAPKCLTADAGYGSEENYTLLEGKNITAYVKYSLFDKRQNRAYNKKHPFSADKLFYNAKADHYICPMGQKMHYIGNSKRKTVTGFEQTARLYKAINCQGCPLNGVCHKSKSERIIQININLERQKKKADELLKVKKVLKNERSDVLM